MIEMHIGDFDQSDLALCLDQWTALREMYKFAKSKKASSKVLNYHTVYFGLKVCIDVLYVEEKG